VPDHNSSNIFKKPVFNEPVFESTKYQQIGAIALINNISFQRNATQWIKSR